MKKYRYFFKKFKDVNFIYIKVKMMLGKINQEYLNVFYVIKDFERKY